MTDSKDLVTQGKIASRVLKITYTRFNAMRMIHWGSFSAVHLVPLKDGMIYQLNKPSRHVMRTDFAYDVRSKAVPYLTRLLYHSA